MHWVVSSQHSRFPRTCTWKCIFSVGTFEEGTLLLAKMLRVWMVQACFAKVLELSRGITFQSTKTHCETQHSVGLLVGIYQQPCRGLLWQHNVFRHPPTPSRPLPTWLACRSRRAAAGSFFYSKLKHNISSQVLFVCLCLREASTPTHPLPFCGVQRLSL